MGWIRISDDFYDNDKIELVGPHGIAIYVVAMAYCNRNLTDGFFPKSKAKTFLDVDQLSMTTMRGEFFAGGVDGLEAVRLLAELMVAAGLWHESGHDCVECHERIDGGEPSVGEYLIHDYLSYQPSKAQVEERRDELSAQRAAAGRLGGIASGESRRSKPEAKPKQNLKQNRSKTEAPNPNPNNSLVTYGGEGYVSNAREPRPACSRHPDVNFEGKCRACMKRRLWDEENEAALKADELDLKRRQRALAENCPVCQGTNWIPDTDPAVKCDHQAVQHA